MRQIAKVGVGEIKFCIKLVVLDDHKSGRGREATLQSSRWTSGMTNNSGRGREATLQSSGREANRKSGSGRN